MFHVCIARCMPEKIHKMSKCENSCLFVWSTVHVCSLPRAFGKSTNCQHVKYLPFGYAEVLRLISMSRQCEQTLVQRESLRYLGHIIST